MAEDKNHQDLPNFEKQQDFLAAEEFPEGAYGNPLGSNKPVENKSTPWKEGQQYYSAYTYEYRNLHQDLPRQVPGAHHTHDEKDKNEE